MRAPRAPEQAVPSEAPLRVERGAPKAQRLREALLGLMRDLPEGAPLPTERELCADYAVSRATVRSVLQALELEQRIYRRQGKGTFVARQMVEQRLGLASHSEALRASGVRTGSKLIDVSRVEPGAEIASALGLPAGGEALRIERLRLADGEPIGIEALYLDAGRFDGISSLLGDGVSFHQLLATSFGVELASAEDTIEATLAGPHEAGLLGCAAGSALLRLSRLALDTGGAPVEYVQSVYRADRYRYRQRFDRPAGLDVPGPRLRRATAADAPALAEVFVSSWREAYPGIVDAAILDALDTAEVADWLASMLGQTNQTTVLAEDPPGLVAGFVRYGADPDDSRMGHVYSLYAHPRAGRRGIGRHLLQHALGELSPGALRPVSLWVFEKNERARALYTSLGFGPNGATRVEPQYGAQEIKLVRP